MDPTLVFRKNGIPRHTHIHADSGGQEIIRLPPAPSHGEPSIHWEDGDYSNCTLRNLSWRKLGDCPYRGVSRKYNRWYARVKTLRGSRYFFSFDTPEEAARAYDKAARELLGSRVRLNFPQSRRLLTVECLPGRDSDPGL